MSAGNEPVTVHGLGSCSIEVAQEAGETKNTDEEDLLRTGHRFKELLCPEDTWTAIWDGVRQALAKRGHTAVNIRSVHRLDPNDKKSRWKRQQVVCKCFGMSKAKKIEDVEKQRKSHSAKTNCPFKVTVSWPRTGPPVVTQHYNSTHDVELSPEEKTLVLLLAPGSLPRPEGVLFSPPLLSSIWEPSVGANLSNMFSFAKVVLDHNERCNARTRQAVLESCISPGVLQRECYDDIRQWTMAGLRKTDMFRLLNARFAPLKLGEEGRRKVRNLAAKIERELLTVDGLRTDLEAPDVDALEDDVGEESDSLKVSDDRPRSAVRDRLLLNLQRIANREASRLCMNLGPRLTPEMAMAVFQGLTIEVDALISGSGAEEIPAAGPGASQYAPALGAIHALSPPPESLHGAQDPPHVSSEPGVPSSEMTGMTSPVPQIDIGEVCPQVHVQDADPRTSPAKRSKLIVS